MPKQAQASKSAIDQRKVIHITSQGKGGVYKSGAASLLAQFLREHDHDVLCYDTDPTNATFFHFEALDVIHLDVTNGRNAVDESKFNTMTNQLATVDGPWVVDTGATIFNAFWHYVEQTNLMPFFADQGKRVIIHCPVMGGQEVAETVKGLCSICEVMPAASVVVWLNHFHGEIKYKAVSETGEEIIKRFDDFQGVKDNIEKILGRVELLDDRNSVRSLELQALMRDHRTFEEARVDPKLGLIEKNTLLQVKRAIWQQLEVIF